MLKIKNGTRREYRRKKLNEESNTKWNNWAKQVEMYIIVTDINFKINQKKKKLEKSEMEIIKMFETK